MKKTRQLTILLLVLTMLCSIFVITSCGGGGNNNGDNTTLTPPSNTPTKLAAPTVTLTDDVAMWNTDASADKFEISVDGNLSYIENSVTSKKLTDGQTFKIRAIGDGTNYTNSDWSNSVTYTKPSDPPAPEAKYTITWKNGDTVLETDIDITEGTIPTYDGTVPTKEADAQYSYTFSGWTPEVVAANDDATYTAVFTSIKNKYTVTWKNGDTILETDENVEYGTMPTYDGAEPQKAADAQYIYVFNGWSPVVSEVVGNVTYEAQFTSAPNTYTVVWKNGDTVLETDENVPYGTTPTYDDATPIKESTAQYTYTFNGWSPEINSVTESITYTAQFAEVVRKYTITFYSEDGNTILDAVSVDYGSTATYSKGTPTKNSTNSHTYTFDKWVSTQSGNVVDDLSNVTGDRSVYASFKEFVRTVTVYIVSNNTDYGTVSVSTLNNVPYGTTITVNENTITINGQTVTAQANTATAQYAYTFTNWSADATVGNDTVITANFSRSLNSYTVIWKNGDTVLETDNSVSYGATPNYNGETPTKAADAEYTYTFSGWTPSISNVTGDITYYAQFTNSANKYTVTFYDDDGITVLGTSIVVHGETASYSNSLPTKTDTAQHAYVFDKWVTVNGGGTEAVLTNVTGDMNVYASYKATTKIYSVRILTNNDTYGSVSTTILNNIPYGTEIVLNGNNLTIGENTIVATATTSTPQYTYSFSSWTAANAITGDTVITANFTRSVNKYTVVWKNAEETLEKDENVEYGSTPIYNGAMPTKPSTAEYSYTFSGWSPSISPVTGDVTYYAQFTDATNKYTVTFYDDDGSTVLNVVAVDYGQKAEFSHSNPTKSSTAQYSYTFSKWVTEKDGAIEANLTSVTSNVSVYASYTLSVRTYSVQITTNNVNYGTVSKTVLNDIPYGTEIVTNGNNILIGDTTVVAVATADTAQYTYNFSNWNANTSITGDTVITANFNRSTNTYTVTWKNGEEVLEKDENVEYGATPVYNGEIPTKPSDAQYTYTFNGWTPSVSAVTGNVTYSAVFTSIVNKYTVFYYDEDGSTLLGSVTVECGKNAEYPNALPTKASTDQYVYSFDKWVTAAGGTTEAKLTNICENISVYAKYIATTKKYTVTFCDWDGTVLDEQLVAYGTGATAPDELERDGYRFDGWDKSYDNVTEDITVTAKYIAVVEVKFLDYDGSVIYSEYIDQGSNFTNIPADPTRSDYVFTGWSTNAFENIVEDLEVQAQYVRTYRVSFVDYNGNVLKTENVMTGTAATAPTNPSREGYDFVGWDTEFSSITSDLRVTARYQIKRYTVTFVRPDGKIVSVQENIKHGFSATAPEIDEYYFDWNTRKGYKFTGWNKSIDSITASVTITAVYDQEVTEPIIVVQSTSVPSGTTSVPLRVFVCSSKKIYGISLDMIFDSKLLTYGSMDIDVLEFPPTKDNYTSEIKNGCEYELRWTLGDGVDSSGGPIPLLTCNLNLYSLLDKGDYLVDILASTYIINEDLVKVTPVVISGTVTLGN